MLEEVIRPRDIQWSTLRVRDTIGYVNLYDEFLKGLGETPRKPAVEPLWTSQHDGRTVSCVLHYHGP